MIGYRSDHGDGYAKWSLAPDNAKRLIAQLCEIFGEPAIESLDGIQGGAADE